MTALICVMYVLVTLDAAFSGICAASGRNALIRKRGYYLRSMWHGALWGQAAILLGLVLVTVTVQLSPNRLRTLVEIQVAGWRMATVSSIYAVFVMSTFLLFSPSAAADAGSGVVRGGLVHVKITQTTETATAVSM